eukprot:m.90380 g.90380  ORF g.90380 m.90380 type:complete len:689 (+) comp26392_c0_seq1:207-2273(+)
MENATLLIGCATLVIVGVHTMASNHRSNSESSFWKQLLKTFAVLSIAAWLEQYSRSGGGEVAGVIKHTFNNDGFRFNNTDNRVANVSLYEMCGDRHEVAVRPKHFFWPGSFTAETIELLLVHFVVGVALIMCETRRASTPDFVARLLEFAMLYNTCRSLYDAWGGEWQRSKLEAFFVVALLVVWLLGELLRTASELFAAVENALNRQGSVKDLVARSFPAMLLFASLRLVGTWTFLVMLVYTALRHHGSRSERTKWGLRVVVLAMIVINWSDYNDWNKRFFTDNPDVEGLCNIMPAPVACKEPTTGEIVFSDVESEGMPLDKLFLTYTDHLWANYHVGLPEAILIAIGGPVQPGMVGYQLQKLYARVGLNKPAPDYKLERQLYLAITGSSLSGWVEFPSDDDNEAIFKTLRFRRVYLDADDKPANEYGTFQCLMDFDLKKTTNCTFAGEGTADGEGRLLYVSPSDALACAAGIVTGAAHPEIHGYTNWVLDTEDPNPYLRRMSLISVQWNYMGATANPPAMDKLLASGLTTYTTSAITKQFVDPLPLPKPQEYFSKRLQRLAKLGGRYAKFVVPLREWFYDNYPGVEVFGRVRDPQALFGGMILHALDHGAVTRLFYVRDVFEDSPDFAGVVEMSYVPVTCFIDNQPWRPVGDVSVKNSPIKFYQELYKFAATLDQEYADHLEAAIAK